MATRNGSTALGHDTGIVAEARKADLIVVDMHDPVFTPLVHGNRNQLYSHLAFAASGNAVRTVIIDGHVVMQDRRIDTVDIDEVMAKATEAFATGPGSGGCRRRADGGSGPRLIEGTQP